MSGKEEQNILHFLIAISNGEENITDLFLIYPHNSLPW